MKPMNTIRAKPLIALAMGDPAGIGPELIVKLLSDDALHRRCRPFVIGDLDVMTDSARTLKAPLRFRGIDALSDAGFAPEIIEVLNPPDFALGQAPPPAVHPKLGKAAALYLELACGLARQSLIDGIVAAPMNKESFRMAGYDYADELAFLGDITNSAEPFLLGAVGPVRAVAVTEHIALKDVAGCIKRDRVLRYIHHLDGVLGKLGFAHRRIAVAALNPHAGEGGLFGTEEIDEIAPAVQQAQKEGVHTAGPVPADIVFKQALEGAFDGVVCMYHDQMNIARKLQPRGQIATVWMGLPVIGATTAHGTAFDIAGQGIADPGSLQAALDCVVKLAT